MINRRLKDIAQYIGLTSFPCKACGCINTLDEVIVHQEKDSEGRVLYKAFCGHCDNYMLNMPTAKIKRLWWKGEMQEIAKLDTGLLLWMLKQSYGSKNNSRYIRAVLKTRLDKVEVPDLPFEEVSYQIKQKLKLNKHKEAMNIEIEERKVQIKLMRERIVKHFGDWDAIDMDKAENSVRKWERRIAFLEKKIKKAPKDFGV